MKKTAKLLPLYSSISVILLCLIFAPRGFAQKAVKPPASAQASAPQEKNDFGISKYTALIKSEPNNDGYYAERSRSHFYKSNDLKTTSGENTAESDAEIDLAFADAEKAIALNPRNTTALNVRGIVKSLKNDEQGAIADYTRAIEIDPKAYKAYLNRAIGRTKLRDTEGAIADYTKAIQIEPKLAQAYQNRGGLYRRQNKNSEAVADFTKVLELEPNNKQAADALAKLNAPNDDAPILTMGGIKKQRENMTPEMKQQMEDVTKAQEELYGSKTGGNLEEVSSNNRLNFYTGLAFSQTASLTNQIDNFGSGNQLFANALAKKISVLNSVLKGRTEAGDLAAAYKKFQQSKVIKDFMGDLRKINSKYEASLTTEQKWYFQLGMLISDVQYGMAKKNQFGFFLTDESFKDVIKSVPAKVSPSFVTLLKKTAQTANSDNFSYGDADNTNYALLNTQVKSIFNSINGSKVNSQGEYNAAYKELREYGFMAAEENKQIEKEAELIVSGMDDPKNRKALNDFAESNSSFGDANYKMTELALSYQNVKKKFAEFEPNYSKPQTDIQRTKLLDGIISEYQKALTEIEKTEKLNLNFTDKDKKSVADYKDYYTKVISILKGMRAERSR